MWRPYKPVLNLKIAFPFLKPKRAVILHPRFICRKDNPFESKFHGQLAWPKDEDWPTCPVHNWPLVGVLQLRRDEVPQLGFPDGADLFQLLWCASEHEDIGHSPLSKAFWRYSGTIQNIREFPWSEVFRCDEETEDQYIPPTLFLNPDEVEDYPPSSTLDDEQLKAINKYIRESGWIDRKIMGDSGDNPYSLWFEAAPISKVGGFASWIHDPETLSCTKCGSDMDHLVTLANTEIAYPSKARWNFCYNAMGRMYIKGDYASDFEPDLYHHEDDVEYIGGYRRYYVMMCRRCEDRPIRATYQRSVNAQYEDNTHSVE